MDGGAGHTGKPGMIVLERVTKSWGGRRAVGPLSLTIPQGQFVALLGGSGCGKTTTLKMINALVAPESGLVRIDGRAVEPEQVTALRRGIGYVFQEIGLFPHMSVAGNIGVGPKLAGWTQERIAARIAELLALVALPAEVAARFPAELSGGQRQRVGCRACAGRGPPYHADGRTVRRARSDHPRRAGPRISRAARHPGPDHGDGHA